MKRVTRRTKRMVAIIIVYMIVVINVITAYASNTTYYFIDIGENGEAEIVTYTPEADDSDSGSGSEEETQTTEETSDDAGATEVTDNTETVEPTNSDEEVAQPADGQSVTEDEKVTEPMADGLENPAKEEQADGTITDAPDAVVPTGESVGSSDNADPSDDTNTSASQQAADVSGLKENNVTTSTGSENVADTGKGTVGEGTADNTPAPTSGKVIDEKVLEEAKQGVDDLLDGISKLDNFVIYADKYSTTTHIDGNIAVNEFSNEVGWTDHEGNEVKYDSLEDLKGTGDNYSYIGSTKSEGGLTVQVYENQGEGTKPATNVATLVVGDENIKIQNNNAGAEVVDISGVDLSNLDNPAEKKQAEEALKEALDGRNIDAEKFLDEIQIEKNLGEIAEQGEKAKEAVDKIWADETGNKKLTNEEASKKVATAATEIVKTMAEEEVTDAVIVFDVDVSALNNSSDEGLPKIIERLMEANKEIGATIVINMVLPEDGSLNTDISLCQPINSTAYAAETAYVVWNFGNYSGNINVTKAFTGIVVAPEATIVATDVINGRVIADDVWHNKEIHTPNEKPGKTPRPSVTPKPSNSPKPEGTPTPVGTPTPADTPKPEETPTPEATPTNTPEPEETPTPEATPTNTPEPEGTPTPEATPTNTPEPEGTPTPEATPTNTPEPEGTPTPEATPVNTPEPEGTPEPGEMPTPEPTEAPTPGTTPGNEPTPPPTGEPTPEPGDEPTPPPTPEDEPTPEITVTPAPEIPVPTPEGTVLGARRIQESGPRAAVLGARRGSNYAVLGKRRRPATGDSVAMLIWILALAAAIGGAVTSTIALHNSKKK